jgi:hypothetical protein
MKMLKKSWMESSGPLGCALLFCVFAVATAWAQPRAAAARPAKKTDAKEVADAKELSKSTFESPKANPNLKDPFFPSSTRHGPVAVTNTGPLAPPAAPTYDIAVKGISGRIALINNQPMAAGESAKVRTSQGSINVELLEIKERSVVIRIEGETKPKEIFLPPSS